MMSEPLGWAAVEFAPEFPGAERRAAARCPANLRAAYRVLAAEGGAGQARVRNLSPLGVGLTLSQPVPICSLLHLAFEGAGVGPVLARVVYATADADRVVGCAFVRELDDALRLFHAARLPATAGDERRWVRFPCHVETACYAADAAPGEQSPARIADISAGGVGLLLPCEFSPGTLLMLDLEGTPAHAAGPVLLRVMRATARRAGDWLLGCEFARRLDDAEIAAVLQEAPSDPA